MITARRAFVFLSVVSLLVCAGGAVFHYKKWAWGNLAQPLGWVASMVFLLFAFSPKPRELGLSLKSSINRRTAFFAFCVLIFTASRLWHFSTAPWNGNGLFDESGWDLWYLKSYVLGHPFQPAWFHSPIARETLFHYYLVPFFSVFGYNILSYEAGLFVLWCATFLFTLLLVHRLFNSYVVTALTGLVFNFLPFAFIYTFAGYRYPMATALCVASLYFLHRGFQTDSRLSLSWGGLLAGLCLASSISGKQYLAALFVCALLYPLFNRKAPIKWRSLVLVSYAGLAGAMPILCYIAFNRHDYTLYESGFVESFMQALRGHPAPNDFHYYTQKLWICFFRVPGDRFFIPDVLPVPLPYYYFLVSGLILALWQKRFDIVLLATISVAGAFIAAAFENRLLLAIPFWMILMAFSFAGLLKLKAPQGLKYVLWGASAVVLMMGLVPSIRYINAKTKAPFSVYHFAQDQVAVSRFLRLIVAGKGPANPRLERDEFNRVTAVDPSYDTLICQKEAYSIIHLFLHDYDETKILSPTGGLPFFLMGEREIWSHNKNALLNYSPGGKDLKLVWEIDPSTNRIITLLRSVQDPVAEESVSYSFEGHQKKFSVFSISADKIRPFQDRLRALPDSL